MKRFLSAVISVTFIASLYVFQHSKLLECSYRMGKAQKQFSLMVDRNRQLRYNVNALERPGRLEDILLAKKTEVAMPQQWYKIHVPPANERQPISTNTTAKSGPFVVGTKIIMSMFSLDTEAVAKELSN